MLAGTSRKLEPNNFVVADFVILSINETIVIPNGQTASKQSSAGKGKVFEVIKGGDVCIKIMDISWQNGERDVRAIKVKGPLELRRLERGALRIGIKKKMSFWRKGKPESSLLKDL